jgi:hypothetical protein
MVFEILFSIRKVNVIARHNMRVTIAVSSLLFFFLSAFSQSGISFNNDTSSTTGWQPFKVREVQYYIGEDEQILYTVDTSLQNFQVYDPALTADFNFRTTGSIGLPAYYVFFQPNKKFGFDLGYNAYDLYNLTRHNMRHYKTTTPYTELNMMIGRKREQMVNIYHAQTIKNRFDFSFEYNRTAGKGFFRQQESNNNNFAVGVAYRTKKQHYKISPTFIFNNINVQENGGVSDADILFKDTTLVSKELIGINLADARTQMRDRQILLKQELAFGKMLTQKINDTLTVQELAPVFKIYHQGGYMRNKVNYVDNNPDSNFYKTFFPPSDTLISRDTLGNYLFLQSISNKAGIILQFVDSYDSTQVQFKNFLLDLSVEHEFFRLQYSAGKTALQNLNFIGFMSNHPSSEKRLLYKAKAAFSFIDYNSGDLLLEGKLGYKFKIAGTIEAGADLQRSEPGWFFQHFSIRGTEWNNDFKKVNRFSVGVDYSLPKYHVFVSGRFHNITNLLYSDSEKMPQQYTGNIQAWVLSASKNFRFKGLGLDNLVRLQFFTGSDLIRVPKVWLRHSLFYERKLFKGALQPRIGIDMTYNTNYYANGYFPLTGQFYVQDVQWTKFYPVFDVFASFKIKTFRIFLKVDHVNQGWLKQRNYYNFYTYPGVQRSFRIGISWRFYD